MSPRCLPRSRAMLLPDPLPILASPLARQPVAAAPLLLAPALASAADPAPYRYRAPIVVESPAPFVELALPPAAYGHVEQDDLRDLRVVDARGERVPFAVLPSRSTVRTSEQV